MVARGTFYRGELWFIGPHGAGVEWLEGVAGLLMHSSKKHGPFNFLDAYMYIKPIFKVKNT